MDFIGMVLFLALLYLVLYMFGGKFNLPWMICSLFLYYSMVEDIHMYSIPASIFAVAGAIMNLKQDKNSSN